MTDSWGRVAASRPASSAEAQLYLVPASTEFMGQLWVCNQDSSTIDFSVALTDTSGAAAGEDWLVYEKSLASGSFETLSFSMGAGESLRIKASSANVVSFVLEGLVIT